MTHVVDDKCINCKHTTCVGVCPVDCFYEGENMLVINTDECIDCGVCVSECPEEAIFQTDDKNNPWYQHNEHFGRIWPNITKQTPPMDGWEEFSNGKHSDKTKLFKNK